MGKSGPRFDTQEFRRSWVRQCGAIQSAQCSPDSLRTLDRIGFWRYIPLEEWEVEFTDEFGTWWEGLSEAEQVDVRAEVNLLRRFGPSLGRPHVDSVASSKHGNMKEMRVQHRGRPYRVLFAFDPRRTAILLIGGNKTDSR